MIVLGWSGILLNKFEIRMDTNIFNIIDREILVVGIKLNIWFRLKN